MLQRRGQARKKARLARQANDRKVARASGEKPAARKPAPKPAPKPKADPEPEAAEAPASEE